MSLLTIIARTALGLASTASLSLAAPSISPRASASLSAPAAPASPTAPVAAPVHRIAPSAPLLAAPAAPATATEIVDRVQQFYAGIKQVTALFRQSVTAAMYGSTKNSDGTVWIMKPGKMRWDYVEKKKVGNDTKVEVKKSFISNGSYLYVVEHDNKQVLKKNLERDMMPVAVSFLYGKGDLKAEFNAELDTSGKYGAKDDIVLRLTPKQPSAQYKSLYLVVSPKDFHVTQSVVVDASNNINHFRFYAPDFEKPIKDSYFEFDERSVKNYRVTDADASPGGIAGTSGGAPGAPPAGSAAKAPPADPKAPAPPARP
jgi:outer membrane lipoprotein carrier protein